MVYSRDSGLVCPSGLSVLENERLIEERYNVKPGDMIMTDIGTGILIKETRAYWFYLFRDRVNRIKKAQFWQMIDCGNMRIKYAENKKYRRTQKRYRTLDMRGISTTNIERELDEFLNFVSFPSSVVFGPNSSDKLSAVFKKLNEMDLEYYEEKGFSSELRPVIRIVG